VCVRERVCYNAVRLHIDQKQNFATKTKSLALLSIELSLQLKMKDGLLNKGIYMDLFLCIFIYL